MNKPTKKGYTVAETFIGAGGSHLGFKEAGFNCVYANDNTDIFIKTLLKNNPELSNSVIDVAPIENVDAKSILKRTGLERGELDVLVGGTVCKGFSLAGVRDPNDKRNTLYKEQLRLVKILRPKISIIENVPSMQNMMIPNSRVPKKISKRISYVWQMLENYKGIKAKLRKEKKELSKKESVLYENIKKEKKSLEEFLKRYSISVVDDIEKTYEEMGYKFYKAKLNAAWYGSATKRIRLIMVAVRKDIKLKYHYPRIEFYDKSLGSTSEIHVTDNPQKPISVKDALNSMDIKGVNSPKNDLDNRSMSHAVKTIERFRYIPQGQNIVDVMEKLPKELHISKYYSRGCTMRLDPNIPAPTLVPGHSNFPVHPTEHRSITVREAAVISGFPLTYQFQGSHTLRCEQIGNAVPIKLASAIAKSVKKLLDEVNGLNLDTSEHNLV